MADKSDRADPSVKKIVADLDEVRIELAKQSKQLREQREEMEKRFEQVDKRFEQVDKRFEQVDETLDEIHGAVIDIQRTQTALTDVMTRALKELGVSRSFETRLKRLEDHVFGSKH